MMKVSQNTNETNGPHKRLYRVISVVEHGSLVQNLGCFKSMSSLTNNYSVSWLYFGLNVPPKGKVIWKRGIGLSREVYNIPRLHLPCLSSKKLDHDQTSDLWFTRLAT